MGARVRARASANVRPPEKVSCDPLHSLALKHTCLFWSAPCDFSVASVNYMSPPLIIKPNRCLIIDGITYYATVPLLQEGSDKELFFIKISLRLETLPTIPTNFSCSLALTH